LSLAAAANWKAGRLSLKKSHVGKSKGVVDTAAPVELNTVTVVEGVSACRPPAPSWDVIGKGRPPFPKILNKLDPNLKVPGKDAGPLSCV
jgi:hypothetical protein